MEPITQQLLSLLPPRLRALLRPDSRQELLNTADECLMVFEDHLYRLATNSAVALADPGDAGELARAAAQLLGDQAGDCALLLLLPSDEFVAVSAELPGISADNLASALSLQADSLLPACEEALAMAVNADPTDKAEQHIALWMRQQRLDALFEAFAECGIFLAAVRPRLLAALQGEEEIRLLESSAAGKASVIARNKVLSQWLQFTAADSEQPQFVEQWHQELKSHPTARRLELSSAEDYLQHMDSNAGAAYSFYPAGALAARGKVQQVRRLRAGLVSLAAVVLVGALPFLWQSFQFAAAQRALNETRELAAGARGDQAVVVDFENEWGAVSDFPEQNISQVMFALQNALAPDQLTSLDISEGLISIEGNSQDPQAILQKLEQDPLFTEVVFARATNNNRYFIDLRLSPVNFEGYFRRYFPDQ